MIKPKYILLRYCIFISLIYTIGCEVKYTDLGDADSEVAAPIEGAQVVVDTLAFGQNISITGKLINTLCYSGSELDISDECAIKNTKNGLPIAVFEDGKKVSESWILLINPQIFSDYMNEIVRVSGEVRGKGVLMPIRVEIETEKGWMFIM